MRLPSWKKKKKKKITINQQITAAAVLKWLKYRWQCVSASKSSMSTESSRGSINGDTEYYDIGSDLQLRPCRYTLYQSSAPQAYLREITFSTWSTTVLITNQCIRVHWWRECFWWKRQHYCVHTTRCSTLQPTVSLVQVATPSRLYGQCMQQLRMPGKGLGSATIMVYSITATILWAGPRLGWSTRWLTWYTGYKVSIHVQLFMQCCNLYWVMIHFPLLIASNNRSNVLLHAWPQTEDIK